MIVADTNILIGAIRGNELAQAAITRHLPAVYLSAITEIELWVGATNHAKKDAVTKVLQSHEVLPLTRSITEIAVRLVKTHNTGSRSLTLPDALIAATCLDAGCGLLTFNTKDFSFIKGLKLVR